MTLEEEDYDLQVHVYVPIVTVLSYIFYNLIKLNLHVTVLCFQGIYSKSGRSEATNKITEYFKVFCNMFDFTVCVLYFVFSFLTKKLLLCLHLYLYICKL